MIGVSQFISANVLFQIQTPNQAILERGWNIIFEIILLNENNNNNNNNSGLINASFCSHVSPIYLITFYQTFYLANI